MKVRFDQSAPYEVDEQDTLFAKPGGQELLARVYRPKGEAERPLAALVDVHGGAWSRNDRTSGAVHGRGLSASGLVVVSLDFRQGSAHKHPAASADVAAGVRYVRAHAGRLGIDPRRVGIVGSSSGGQLALLAGLKPGAPEHAGTPIVTVEDHALIGGFGTCVIEACHEMGLDTRKITRMGLPDRWVYQGGRGSQQKEVGIDADAIARTVRATLDNGGKTIEITVPTIETTRVK